MAEYLFNCRECKKDDTEFPIGEIQCEECKNGGGDCWKCGGYGKYQPTIKVKYHRWARFDYRGIYTELCCDKCYANGNYSYKKGRY